METMVDTDLVFGDPTTMENNLLSNRSVHQNPSLDKGKELRSPIVLYTAPTIRL